MTIYEKLLTIQLALKVPKGQTNEYGKFKYRSCGDILETLKPLCKENKVLVFLSDTIVAIGERNYIETVLTLIDVETSEKIINTSFAREEETKKGMDGSQITGASSSYARKYALNGMFAIDDTADSDATNKGENKPQTQKPSPIKLETPICSQCLKEITSVVDTKGKPLSPNELSAKTGGLCMDCAKLSKGA